MGTRRGFLAGLFAASALPRLSWADAGDPCYLAAAKERDGGYALFGLDGQGRDLFRIALPDRGHAAAAHPVAPEAVAFARRPGTFALVIDCVTGAVAHRRGGISTATARLSKAATCCAPRRTTSPRAGG